MFKVTVANKTYEVDFHHHPHAQHIWGTGETGCYIHVSGYEIWYPAGVAFCSDSERGYDEMQGEKHSLADALRRFPFTKEQKRRVWKAFFISRGYDPENPGRVLCV